jgi:hypothetical protein
MPSKNNIGTCPLEVANGWWDKVTEPHLVLERHPLAEIVRHSVSIAQGNTTPMNAGLVGDSVANLDLIGCFR